MVFNNLKYLTSQKSDYENYKRQKSFKYNNKYKTINVNILFWYTTTKLNFSYHETIP